MQIHTRALWEGEFPAPGWIPEPLPPTVVHIGYWLCEGGPFLAGHTTGFPTLGLRCAGNSNIRRNNRLPAELGCREIQYTLYMSCSNYCEII